jgi:hypothetical protein
MKELGDRSGIVECMLSHKVECHVPSAGTTSLSNAHENKDRVRQLMSIGVVVIFASSNLASVVSSHYSTARGLYLKFCRTST